jgi:hypothetical protein
VIISLAGRKHSGKSILAQTLIDKGFIKLSFATKLKQLTAELFDWNVEDLSSSKKDDYLEVPVVWTETVAKAFQQKIKTEKNLYFGDKVFEKRRNALTYIANEILRDTVDVDFHLKSLKEQIEPGKNYVIDDNRFPNELEFLKKIGAHCIYVFRPYYFENYNNDISEISVSRHLFRYVFINDQSKEVLIEKFNKFVDALNNEPSLHADMRFFNSDDDCFSRHSLNTSHWAEMLSKNGGLYRQGDKLVVGFNSADLKLVAGFQRFLKTNTPICSVDNVHGIMVDNCYIVEDLKLWNMKPKN